MLDTARRVEEVADGAASEIDPARLVEAQAPVIFRGLARDWPLVGHGRQTPDRAIDYLKSFYRGRPVVGYTGAPEIGGRYFYNDTLTAMNFQAERVPLDAYLDRIRDACRRSAGAILLCRLDRCRRSSAGPARGERPAAGARRIRAGRAAGQHLDRQPHHRVDALRHVQQHRLLPGRAAALHAVSARSGAQPLSRPARADARRAGGEHGRSARARPGALPALRRGAGRARRWPSSSPATCSSTRRCGGIRSRRSTRST